MLGRLAGCNEHSWKPTKKARLSARPAMVPEPQHALHADLGQGWSGGANGGRKPIANHCMHCIAHNFLPEKGES